MLSDSYFAEINDARREALASSVQTTSVEELKKLGEKLFPYFDHPWREAFFNFLAENENAVFHQAKTQEGFHIVYCREKDKGIWYVENGVGPLQERGRTAMRTILDGPKS